MKFTLSWLKQHLETSASVQQVAEAMTMAGLEVEHVSDAAAELAPFSVAHIVSAARHPNADRLQVCQVETKDGLKEIVCGAPNARAGLWTIYAPIGAYVPGLGVTLVEKPVRGVVSNGMLCSAAELKLSEESDGILELDGTHPVGTLAAEVFALEPVIDFEVTPNRPDWLGVGGIARDLAAAGLGQLITPAPIAVPGKFPCPIRVEIAAPDACPIFAGRVIRGLKNGPSPKWVADQLTAIGLRPISALVDVTNLMSYDRARPLHVYDVAKLSGSVITARLGYADESFKALDGKTYQVASEHCVIADASGPLGFGGVMGGEATGVSLETTEVFLEAAWFDPIRTAQTGRSTGITSDAQYRFARGVDPAFVLPGLELATQIILDLCGGEASDVVVVGEAPAGRPDVRFDPAYVAQLSGLSLTDDKIAHVLTDLGFGVDRALSPWTVSVPSWRRDVEGKADLVEEVARIAGFDALPATPLPEVDVKAGVLSPRQVRVQRARRFLAASGYAEALTWSFLPHAFAKTFGGGADALVLANPIASELDCMRPSILPNLITATGRNAARGHGDAALFEIGPVYLSDGPKDQRTAITAVIRHDPPRHWDAGGETPLFGLKGDLLALLDELGAPTASLQLVQGQNSPWWRPGRSARLQLGPKTVIAEFGELHPSVLKGLDVAGTLVAFELILENLPEAKAKATKSKGKAALSPLQPLSRDFAFVVGADRPAGDLIRAALSADKALITEARVFDVYQGAGVPEGQKSVAVEVVITPVEATLTEAEIKTLTDKVVAAAGKLGAVLRG